MTVDYRRVIANAAAVRRDLFAADDLSCYRLVHGYGEDAPGLEVDRYDRTAVVRYRADIEPSLADIAAALVATGDVDRVVARRRIRPGRPAILAGSEPSARELVREGALAMWLDYTRAGNPGLYLDARPARRWLRDHSDGRRVLNLFAFTGSLGIAAAQGGARVTHVDSHKPTLDWAKDNCRENGIDVDDRDFARMNIYQHLRKSQAGRRRYDGIILDPPPGPPVRRGKDRTPGGRGPRELIPRCAKMLGPGGWLLCLLQHEPERTDADDDALAAEFGFAVTARGTSGRDFPDPAGPPLRWLVLEAS